MNKPFDLSYALVRGLLFSGVLVVGASAFLPLQAAPKKLVIQKATPVTSAVDYTWTEADNGKTKTLKAGQTVKVRLKSNLTTGYSWWVLPPTPPATPHVLMAIGSPKYIAPVTPKGTHPVAGAPGVQEVSYWAQKKGKTQIRLAYKRPWEKDKKPLQTFTVSVVVK